ncbi:MAG TPA: hypothetical protein VHL11_03750, partial [Phototrophicaceae bacterium]|nr:hypothetical protein [Phototrophicaceae bacterium]
MKLKSKKHYSDRSGLNRSVLTFSLSSMMLFTLILSGFTWEDTIQAGYAGATSEMYAHVTTNNFVRDVVNHPAFE